jgi:hypothetical protein
MRFTLGKPSALLGSSVFGLFRILAGLGILAVFLGRSTTEPATPCSPRQPVHPRYLDMAGIGFPLRQDSTPQLLDTETGAITPCPLPGACIVTKLSCSPWRDGQDQYRMVRLGVDKPSKSYALAQCTFPAGRVLDPVTLDVLPSGVACWSPDRSNRILFPSFSGALYLCDLPDPGVARGSGSNPGPGIAVADGPGRRRNGPDPGPVLAEHASPEWVPPHGDLLQTGALAAAFRCQAVVAETRLRQYGHCVGRARDRPGRYGRSAATKMRGGGLAWG